MAKKAVGKVKKHEQKAMVKVIIPFKSPTTGAYKYKQKIVRMEEAKRLLK